MRASSRDSACLELDRILRAKLPAVHSYYQLSSASMPPGRLDLSTTRTRSPAFDRKAPAGSPPHPRQAAASTL